MTDTRSNPGATRKPLVSRHLRCFSPSRVGRTGRTVMHGGPSRLATSGLAAGSGGAQVDEPVDGTDQANTPDEVAERHRDEIAGDEGPPVQGGSRRDEALGADEGGIERGDEQ